MNDTKPWQSQYLTEIDIQKTFKNRKKYKINSDTSTRSHANKNKHKNDNRFREHFSQNLSSQKTRNGVSEHQDFKIYWGSMPQTPKSLAFSALIWFVSDKKKPRFYILKKLDSLSVLTWYCQKKKASITYYTLRSTPLNEKIAKKTVNI